MSACAALAALLLPVQAQAWGFYAHTVTADIALENVRPDTRAEIDRLLEAVLVIHDNQPKPGFFGKLWSGKKKASVK